MQKDPWFFERHKVYPGACPGVGVRGSGHRGLSYTTLLQSHLAIRNAKSSGFFVREGEVFKRNSL